MKIGIDARMLTERGIGRYIEQLIKHLEKIDTENQYYIFLNKDGYEKYNPTNFNFSKVLADYKWYTLEEHFGFAKLLKKYKLDLVHFTHFNVPFFYNKPFVVTIHDLIALKFPTTRATTLGPLKYKIKKWGSKIIIKRAIRKAKNVITISEFTKNDLIEYFKLKKNLVNKISVIYEGVTKLDSTQALSKSEFIENNPQITGYDYIVYVGSAYPHKNIEKLCEAFKQIDDIKLVLVGKEDYFYKRIREEYKDLINNKVFLTGYVSDSELLDIIKQAKFYIFPSLYEGFGLPPLEAMQYGVPVLSSYSSCLPEILKDCVEYFDATYINEIVQSIKSFNNNTERLNNLKIQGPLFVKRYQWQACANETFDIYKKSVKIKNKIKLKRDI